MTTRKNSRSILHMVAAAGIAVGTGLGGTAVSAAVSGSDVANALPTAKARPGIQLAACGACKPACGACNPCKPACSPCSAKPK